eukprot:4005110-Amphidinium_carterae.1
MENLRKLDRPFGAHGMSSSPTVLVNTEVQDDWSGSGAWGIDQPEAWWPEDEYWGEWSYEDEGDWSQPYQDGWDPAWEYEGEPPVEQPPQEESAGLAEAEVVSEEQMNDIYAQMGYGAARAAMQQDRLARGYSKGKSNMYPGGKGKPKGKGWASHGYAKGKSKSKVSNFPSWSYGDSKGAQKGGAKGKNRLQMLIARTRCNTCGQVGHWSKTCPMLQKGASAQSAGPSRSYASFFVYADGAEPDVSGKGATRSFVVASSSPSSLPLTSSVTVPLETSSLTVPSSVTVPLETSSLSVPLGNSSLTLSTPSLVLSSFIGLTCQAGTGLIDTGAQTAVMGKPAFDSLEAALRARGLKGLEIKGEDVQGARGIGGQATILSIQQVPIGLSKVPGVMLVQVLDQDVPLLLPIGMLRKLGMVLDLQRMRCRLSKLNKDAKLIVEPSGRISVNVLDFDNWSPPGMNLAVMQQPGLHVWHSMLSQAGQTSRTSTSVLTEVCDVGKAGSQALARKGPRFVMEELKGKAVHR